ncbi:MAG: cellulose biosynthesis cyclic di-GMP-binding regulatory protein BcsB [Sphingobacteriia bacterium]|nr:cellulose biosynthesis cyclic di-GMP-binding regulatory protein BcsB [Sphingobacteriia bacterium]
MKLRILVVLSSLLVFVQASNAQLFQRRDSSILNKERQKFRINTESKYVERSLEYMGYDDAFITGLTGSLTYFVKIKPNDDLENCTLVMQIRASQVLNPRTSFLVLYLKDVPILTQPINVNGVDSVITMKAYLAKKYLQPDGRFIKVKIAARMSVTDEPCKDVDNIACWVRVKNSSYLAIYKNETPLYQRSLKEWFQDCNQVYTPATNDLDDLTAGGLAYTLLKQSGLKEVPAETYRAEETIPDGAVVCGLPEKLPASVRQELPSLAAGQGYIGVIKGSLYSGHSCIVVTGGDAAGYKKAINTMANNKKMSSTFSDKLLIQEAVPSNVALDNASALVTTLEDLGGTSALMEGIGALQQKYAFSLTEFNAIPNKLTFHLESNFSILKEGDRGFVNIYLNENLIYNASLQDRTEFKENIDLKPYLLTKFNSLMVEFRFYPGNNICKDGFSNFYAFVNPKLSTLTFSGERENKFYSFFNFPAEFRKVPTKVVVSPGLFGSNIASAVGELFYQLNAPIKPDYNKLIVPQLVAADKTSLDDLKGFNIIAMVKRNDAFAKNFSSMPVKFDKDFQIYKDNTEKTTYSINDFSNSGMAQIFRESGRTVLMITSLGDSLTKNAFESVVKNFSLQITEIQSNVCVANSGGVSRYFFKIPEDSGLVTYRDDSSGWSELLSKYKFIILGVLLIALLIAFYLVRGRVKKSQEIV